MNKPYFNNNELHIIADAIFSRRLEAKMELDKIEEGRKEPSMHEYWEKIYNDCNNVYKKLVYYFIK